MFNKDRLGNGWQKLRFDVNARSDFYITLSKMLEQGLSVNVALVELFNIYSDDGRRPNQIIAMIAQACVARYALGKPLSVALADWVSHDEVSLIEAGETAGRPADALRKAAALIQTKRQIGNAVATAAIYPPILLLQMFYLLHQVATNLIPKLAKLSKPEAWTPTAHLLYALAMAVNSYGWLLLTLFLVALILIFWSLPVLRGPVRVWLDRLPPWSIYRMLYGSTFMLNMAEMRAAGVAEGEAIVRMMRRASPWLKERLEATLNGVNNGHRLGMALYKAEYNFPDARAVKFLRALTKYKGGEANIELFAHEWIEDSIKNIKRAALWVMGSAIILNYALLILVLVGANGFGQAMLSNMGH